MTPQVTGIIEEIMTQIDSAVEMLEHYNDADDIIPQFADGFFRGKLAALLNILWHISYENFAPSSASCPFRYFWREYSNSIGLKQELEIFEIFKQKLTEKKIKDLLVFTIESSD